MSYIRFSTNIKQYLSNNKIFTDFLLEVPNDYYSNWYIYCIKNKNHIGFTTKLSETICIHYANYDYTITLTYSEISKNLEKSLDKIKLFFDSCGVSDLDYKLLQIHLQIFIQDMNEHYDKDFSLSKRSRQR